MGYDTNYGVNYDISVLIAQIVERDIKDALDVAPKYPHQAIFTIPYYQNQLVSRVVFGVINHYVSQQGNPTDLVEALMYFLLKPSIVKAVVQESFVSILEEDMDWTSKVCIPDSLPPLCELNDLIKQRLS